MALPEGLELTNICTGEEVGRGEEGGCCTYWYVYILSQFVQSLLEYGGLILTVPKPELEPDVDLPVYEHGDANFS